MTTGCNQCVYKLHWVFYLPILYVIVSYGGNIACSQIELAISGEYVRIQYLLLAQEAY